MKNLIEEAKNIAATAASEGRALTSEERETVESAIAGAKAVKADRELASAVEALGAELGNVKPETSAPAKGRTAGERFVQDGAFKSWLDAATVNGTADVKSMPNSPSVLVGGMKATITGASDDYAGALVVNDRYAPVEAAYARELNVLNLITMARTGSDLVEFARVLNYAAGQSVNSAAPKAEGIASDESTMKFAKLTAAVRDVRTFIPASVRALNDVQQLQSLVDAFIRSSILDEVADQIINGDGTGENMEGILNVSGTQSQAFDTDAVTTIRKAIRKVRHTGNGRANAVLLNPEDDEMIDLLINTGGDYIFGGPVSAATPTLWGLPRVVDAAVPQGQAIVGDFRKAVLWERSPVSVAVYPQHSDYAVKGLVAVAGTARAAFGVVNPSQFVICDIESGS
jgi:HK97 family phage major capsid protein